MGTPKAASNNPEYFIEKGRMGGRPTWQETLARQRHPKKRKGEIRLRRGCLCWRAIELDTPCGDGRYAC